MSKGEINKPKDIELPDSKLEKLQQEMMYKIVEGCEVDVDDSEWEESDKEILEKLEKLNESINTLKDKIGDTEGSLANDLKGIKQDFENLKKRKPLEIAIKVNNEKSVNIGLQHYQFETLITILSANLNAYIVGPAGSGKTTAAMNCAKALNIDFYFTGAIASEFKLTGFIDANGNIVSTEFRKAYENGGLFLFDEIDGSYPQAVLAFNAALANNYMDFPDKRIEKHKDFYCIAAANTFGQGADRQYVGRNQLDAASLDRFIFLDWNFDEKLERELTNNDDWVDFVQSIRGIIESLKIRHVVSPRASFFGSKLLEKGLGEEEVKKLVIWKGLDNATVNKIKENLS